MVVAPPHCPEQKSGGTSLALNDNEESVSDTSQAHFGGRVIVDRFIRPETTYNESKSKYEEGLFGDDFVFASDSFDEARRYSSVMFQNQDHACAIQKHVSHQVVESANLGARQPSNHQPLQEHLRPWGQHRDTVPSGSGVNRSFFKADDVAFRRRRVKHIYLGGGPRARNSNDGDAPRDVQQCSSSRSSPVKSREARPVKVGAFTYQDVCKVLGRPWKHQLSQPTEDNK